MFFDNFVRLQLRLSSVLIANHFVSSAFLITSLLWQIIPYCIKLMNMAYNYVFIFAYIQAKLSLKLPVAYNP